MKFKLPKFGKAKSSKPSEKQAENQEPSPQEKYQEAQAKVDRWSGLLASPDLSPQASEVVRNMHRSAMAELALRQKAMDYQQEASPLATVLGMPPPPTGAPSPPRPVISLDPSNRSS